MILLDFAAQDLVEMMLQCLDLTADFLESGVGDDANLAVFESDSITGVPVGVDSIQPDDFPGHVESHHLHLTVFVTKACFEKAGMYGVDGIKAVTGAIKAGTTFTAAAHINQLVQLLQLAL